MVVSGVVMLVVPELVGNVDHLGGHQVLSAALEAVHSPEGCLMEDHCWNHYHCANVAPSLMSVEGNWLAQEEILILISITRRVNRQHRNILTG